jgi:hypothetical protein
MLVKLLLSIILADAGRTLRRLNVKKTGAISGSTLKNSVSGITNMNDGMGSWLLRRSNQSCPLPTLVSPPFRHFFGGEKGGGDSY